MGPTYGGILGTLAFVIVLMRAVLNGSGLEPTIPIALFALFLFGAFGYVAGRIAEMTVEESARKRMNEELKKLEEGKPS